MIPILSQEDIDDLAQYISDSIFNTSKSGIKEAIQDWYNEIHTEEASTKASKDEQDELDYEQDDLTNSQM